MTQKDSVWVLAYDKNTNKRVGFTCCDEKHEKFYTEKYISDGYAVKVYNDAEIDEVIARENEE